MSVNIRIPDDLYKKALEIANARQVSVDEVFASAFAEQLLAWERLQERASRGDRKKFLSILDRVPDVAPDDSDRF